MSEFISKLRNSGEVSSEQAEFCQEVGIWCIEPIFTNKIMEVMTLLGDPEVLTDGTAEHQFEAEYFVNGARFAQSGVTLKLAAGLSFADGIDAYREHREAVEAQRKKETAEADSKESCLSAG